MIFPQRVMASTTIPKMYVYCVYTAMSCMQTLLSLQAETSGIMVNPFLDVYSAVRVCPESIVFSSN
jgi:hypothetical protein